MAHKIGLIVGSDLVHVQHICMLVRTSLLGEHPNRSRNVKSLMEAYDQ